LHGGLKASSRILVSTTASRLPASAEVSSTSGVAEASLALSSKPASPEGSIDAAPSADADDASEGVGTSGSAGQPAVHKSAVKANAAQPRGGGVDDRFADCCIGAGCIMINIDSDSNVISNTTHASEFLTRLEDAVGAASPQ
jgi:hypothetical protein